MSHAHKGATAHTVIFRSINPKGNFAEYVTFMRQHPLREELGQTRLAQLYRDYPLERYNLSDRGYIAGLNPLELWLVSYLQANPHASRRAILEVSKPVRLESYAWLFHPHLKHAQDTRIRIILEADGLRAHSKTLGATWLSLRSSGAEPCHRHRQLSRPPRRFG